MNLSAYWIYLVSEGDGCIIHTISGKAFNPYQTAASMITSIINEDPYKNDLFMAKVSMNLCEQGDDIAVCPSVKRLGFATSSYESLLINGFEEDAFMEYMSRYSQVIDDFIHIRKIHPNQRHKLLYALLL